MVASDPEVAGLWPQSVDPRYVVQQRAAKALAGKPGARAEVSVEKAADLLYGLLSPELYGLLSPELYGLLSPELYGLLSPELYGLLSPELYLLFARERGWPRERWERWVGETLRARLCSG